MPQRRLARNHRRLKTKNAHLSSLGQRKSSVRDDGLLSHLPWTAVGLRTSLAVNVLLTPIVLWCAWFCPPLSPMYCACCVPVSGIGSFLPVSSVSHPVSSRAFPNVNVRVHVSGSEFGLCFSRSRIRCTHRIMRER